MLQVECTAVLLVHGARIWHQGSFVITAKAKGSNGLLLHHVTVGEIIVEKYPYGNKGKTELWPIAHRKWIRVTYFSSFTSAWCILRDL